jgi:hypothetical protein
VPFHVHDIYINIIEIRIEIDMNKDELLEIIWEKFFKKRENIVDCH